MKFISFILNIILHLASFESILTASVCQSVQVTPPTALTCQLICRISQALKPSLTSSSSPPHSTQWKAAQWSVGWDWNSLNLLQSHAFIPRVWACSACSCSNIAVFPYGGQECMHVSPNPSGRRWNRPQRWRVRERERAGFPPHPSLLTPGLPLHHGRPDVHASYPVWSPL